MKTKTNLIIDFDSTLVTIEALEELAQIALEGNSRKEVILTEVGEITQAGMEGRISFPESLSRRLALFSANREHLNQLIEKAKNSLTPSLATQEVREWIKKNRERVWVLSGGFTEVIEPVTDQLGLKREHVLANQFVFNQQGDIIGVDQANLLCQEQGKVKAVRALNLKGETVMLGDGWTDYEVKKYGTAEEFGAFTENVYRKEVMKVADWEAKDFGEVIQLV